MKHEDKPVVIGPVQLNGLSLDEFETFILTNLIYLRRHKGQHELMLSKGEHQQQQVQHVPNHPSVDEGKVGGATWFEWWQVGILPIVLAIIAYKTVKGKVDQRNAVKRRAWEELQNGDAAPSDETILDFMRSEMTKRKK